MLCIATSPQDKKQQAQTGKAPTGGCPRRIPFAIHHHHPSLLRSSPSSFPSSRHRQHLDGMSKIMSTPTTALPQPLPHYSGARHNGYHHQHYSANPASFHAPYSVVAAPPSRLSLHSPSAHSLSAYSPSSSHSGVLGINHSLTSARPPLQDTTTTLPPLAHNTKGAV